MLCAIRKEIARQWTNVEPNLSHTIFRVIFNSPLFSFPFRRFALALALSIKMNFKSFSFAQQVLKIKFAVQKCLKCRLLQDSILIENMTPYRKHAIFKWIFFFLTKTCDLFASLICRPILLLFRFIRSQRKTNQVEHTTHFQRLKYYNQ